MDASTRSWWRAFWVALAGMAGATWAAHQRDMHRIAVTDAAMDAYAAGKAYGAKTEAARIAAEREAEDDAAPGRLHIETVESGPEGLRVTGVLPPGALADQMAADLGAVSIGWTSSEDVDAAVARFRRQLHAPPSWPVACAVCGADVPPGTAIWQAGLEGWTHPHPGDSGGCE
jgi:hypothetical protein